MIVVKVVVAVVLAEIHPVVRVLITIDSKPWMILIMETISILGESKEDQKEGTIDELNFYFIY
jgi:hypothetical protein